jgi:hypothetical protein
MRLITSYWVVEQSAYHISVADEGVVASHVTDKLMCLAFLV